MSFTFDDTTARGRVRLLITDIDEAYPIFQDSQIDAFLAMEEDNVFLGAALALDTIARSETMILKVIELLDLKTDGASVGRELRQSAKALRERSEFVDAGAFAIVPMIDTDAAWEERMLKNAMRSGGL